MLSARRVLGRIGEDAAAAYLTRQGYVVIARNWRCSIGELDLVAQLGDQVVFVEVRARRGGSWLPEESIGRAKAARLRALAYSYLEAAGLPGDGAWRIDLIAIEVDVAGQITRLEQIESVVADD